MFCSDGPSVRAAAMEDVGGGTRVSTLDAVLPAFMKRMLVESVSSRARHRRADDGQLLHNNSHNRPWVSGLGALEGRQLSCRIYDNYVCIHMLGICLCQCLRNFIFLVTVLTVLLSLCVCLHVCTSLAGWSLRTHVCALSLSAFILYWFIAKKSCFL